jgi:hypothetical protein
MDVTTIFDPSCDENLHWKWKQNIDSKRYVTTIRLRILFSLGVIELLNWRNSSSRSTTLGSTQFLTEISTRNLPGGKVRSPTSVNRFSRNCGNLDVSQPYEPARPVAGITLLLPYIYMNTQPDRERVGLAVTPLNRIRQLPSPNLSIQNILTELFHAFPQSFQANTSTVSRLG